MKMLIVPIMALPSFIIPVFRHFGYSQDFAITSSTSVIDKALAVSDCFFMIVFLDVNPSEWYFWLKGYEIVKMLYMCCKIAY